MITRKVFVLVKNDEIRCYHNLLQLAQDNNLPYFAISRCLAKGKTYKRDNILIGKDTIEYKTKRRNTHFNA